MFRFDCLLWFKVRVTSEFSPSQCFIVYPVKTSRLLLPCFWYLSFSLAWIFFCPRVPQFCRALCLSSPLPDELQPAHVSSPSVCITLQSTVSVQLRVFPALCSYEGLSTMLPSPFGKARLSVQTLRFIISALAVSVGWRNNQPQGRDGGSENCLLLMLISGIYFGLDLEPCWVESCAPCYTNHMFYF